MSEYDEIPLALSAIAEEDEHQEATSVELGNASVTPPPATRKKRTQPTRKSKSAPRKSDSIEIRISAFDGIDHPSNVVVICGDVALRNRVVQTLVNSLCTSPTAVFAWKSSSLSEDTLNHWLTMGGYTETVDRICVMNEFVRNTNVPIINIFNGFEKQDCCKAMEQLAKSKHFYNCTNIWAINDPTDVDLSRMCVDVFVYTKCSNNMVMRRCFALSQFCDSVKDGLEAIHLACDSATHDIFLVVFKTLFARKASVRQSFSRLVVPEHVPEDGTINTLPEHLWSEMEQKFLRSVQTMYQDHEQ